MLQIQHISKSYTTGKLVQKALDDVSLNLRDNEFVAILGPSGSGKTTLLNIIGGLDHYDSGNLIIDGISTNKYRDRDWDSYRNHSVGFVFQSYNLIPHQSILSNVELALTISGIGKRARRRRAAEALAKVGLKEQMHKLPNQLSGGQMQRVAIARALVNDPQILLADEPTGALDSETSVQVMELLQEVAKDRLVVMVTHNAELADTYATRIIKLRDGRIRSDSAPFEISKEEQEPATHKSMGKSSMSFLTALSLSFNNLLTKKARTILTSFAGSIGIIGIALILAASAGINEYIAGEEELMLYAYPIEINNTNVDMNSFFNMNSSAGGKDSDSISVSGTLTRLFSTVGSNDLKALKTYFESGDSKINDYVNAIEYTYDITPQIFAEDNGEYYQVNPNTSLSSLNAGIFSEKGSPMAAMFSNDVFYELPSDEKVYSDQYEVVEGRWPKDYNECVVVLSSSGKISDVMMYALRLRDPAELDSMLEQFMEGKEVNIPEDYGTFDYSSVIGRSYKLVNSTDYYEYDNDYNVWVDKSDENGYLQTLAKNGETLNVVGVVRPTADSDVSLLTRGIYYPASLTKHVVDNSKSSDIVKAQLANPDTDIFTGKPFDEEASNEDIDLSALFDFDPDVITKAFNFDASAIEDSLADSVDFSKYININSDFADLSGMLDLSDISFSVSDANIQGMDLSELISKLDIDVSTDNIASMANSLLDGYKAYIKENPDADPLRLAEGFSKYLYSQDAKDILISNISAIIEANGGINVPSEKLEELTTLVMSGFQEYLVQNGYTDISKIGEYFAEYIITPEAQNIIKSWADENLNLGADITVTQEQLEKLVSELSNGYRSYAEANSLPSAETISRYFLEYIGSSDAQTILTNGILNMVDTGSIENQISTAIEGYVSQMMETYGSALAGSIETQVTAAITSVMDQVTVQLSEGMAEAMGQLTDNLSKAMENAVSIDSDALINAFGLSMDTSELTELLTSLTSADRSTYKNNLAKLGYADYSDPYGIAIYPLDFESKEEVLNILDGYNTRMQASGNEDQVISYTDTTGTLMSSVTDMINIISVVMIAIVAISLIVSSIMIGVITYISVLERKKEIGILRALGASKRNISEVFNAETIIIGLCSGLLGVGIAYALIIPINSLIQGYIDMYNVHIFLPPLYAAALIAISVALTLFSGLIPSTRAAKNDPVEALRTE